MISSLKRRDWESGEKAQKCEIDYLYIPRTPIRPGLFPQNKAELPIKTRVIEGF